MPEWDYEKDQIGANKILELISGKKLTIQKIWRISEKNKTGFRAQRV